MWIKSGKEQWTKREMLNRNNSFKLHFHKNPINVWLSALWIVTRLRAAMQCWPRYFFCCCCRWAVAAAVAVKQREIMIKQCVKRSRTDAHTPNTKTLNQITWLSSNDVGWYKSCHHFRFVFVCLFRCHCGTAASLIAIIISFDQKIATLLWCAFLQFCTYFAFFVH